jgi:hypothetical protein
LVELGVSRQNFFWFISPLLGHMEKQKQELLQNAQRQTLDEFVQLVKKFVSAIDLKLRLLIDVLPSRN